VFNADRGMAVRGTFLVDKAGIVRFAEVNAPGEARDQDAWKKALASVDA
jgi:peroxiredoxin (alkyl hydroperoxide reductase subunit C)